MRELELPRRALRGGISKVNFEQGLSTFGYTCPQNGSKNEPRAPRTSLGYPHIRPFVDGESSPCWETTWAETDNPVYQIEINEINEIPEVFYAELFRTLKDLIVPPDCWQRSIIFRKGFWDGLRGWHGSRAPWGLFVEPALGRFLYTNLPGQWLQCQAKDSNVCRVLRPACFRTGIGAYSKPMPICLGPGYENPVALRARV